MLGYFLVEMMEYFIEELDFFKVVMDKEIIGGIIVMIFGKLYGWIDCIFVDFVY